jgi:putative tryptophan/tyrosine transport system substrate-binding protein
VRRREFITLLGGATAWAGSASAQQPSHIIGLLASQPLPSIQRLRRKLRDYGYVDGENLRFETRFAQGHDERYPDLAAELVSRRVDLIVTHGTPAALAAKHATATIPIVMGAIE